MLLITGYSSPLWNLSAIWAYTIVLSYYWILLLHSPVQINPKQPTASRKWKSHVKEERVNVTGHWLCLYGSLWQCDSEVKLIESCVQWECAHAVSANLCTETQVRPQNLASILHEIGGSNQNKLGFDSLCQMDSIGPSSNEYCQWMWL